MTVTEIINVAQGRTEGRGKSVLDFNNELLAVVQELCRGRKWPWRQKTATLPTIGGTQTYDLSSTSPNNGGATDLEELETMHYVTGGATPTRLDKVVDVGQQAMILSFGVTGVPVAAVPQMWFRTPGTLFSATLSPTPASVYTIRYMYWAVPQTNPATWSNAILVVPAYLHSLLLKGLERNILRYTVGEEAQAYVNTKKEYDDLVGAEAAKYAA